MSLSRSNIEVKLAHSEGVLFTTIASVFQDSYGWNPDICGLAYVGVGLGFLIGLALVARLSDATVI
jgi:predicted MFS family arabinose efflux permease